MDNFQGKGRKHNQHTQKRKHNEKKPKRVREKTLFDNFKEKEGKITKTIRKRNQMKRNEKGSRKKSWWQFPRPFSKQRKNNENAKERKNRI
jgi:hypothetical protein